MDETIRSGSLTSRQKGIEGNVASAMQSPPSGGLGRWSSGSGSESESDLSKMVKATRGVRPDSKSASKKSDNQAASASLKAPERKPSFYTATATTTSSSEGSVAALQNLAALPSQDQRPQSSGNTAAGSTTASNRTTKKDSKKKAKKSKRKPSGL